MSKKTARVRDWEPGMAIPVKINGLETWYEPKKDKAYRYIGPNDDGEYNTKIETDTGWIVAKSIDLDFD